MSKKSAKPRTKLPKLKVDPPGMRRVDNLVEWTAGFSVESYGVRVGVRSNDAKGIKIALAHLPHSHEIVSANTVDRVYSLMMPNGSGRLGSRRYAILYGDDSRLARSLEVEDVFNRFESDLRLFVAEYAHDRVFVHAGVVAWNDRAIIIPGRSFSGKSTLVAELIRAGATYYSDEYAVLDSRGLVHPFPKPLELRESGAGIRQSKVHLEKIGGKAGTKPIRAGMVLMTKFEPEARWRPQKLTLGKGVLELLHNTVSARRSPERALVALQKVAAEAEIVKTKRGSAPVVVPAILKRMDALFPTVDNLPPE